MKKVGIVQINSEFAGQVYFPLVAGYLTSYFKKNSLLANKIEFIPPVFKRDKVINIVEHLQECDIVGFSIYVWNEQLSLAVAKKLKTFKPEIKIVFGGPQVPDIAETYLKKNSFIDICVHNEGELAFSEILECFLQNRNLNVPNTSMLISDGKEFKYVKKPNRAKIRDLDVIPSPFLNGYFDNLIKTNENQTFLGLWESNRGCPFSCTFCDWGSSTASKVNQFGLERLLAEIEWIGSRKIPFVFVCDANFGLLPRDEQIAEYVAKVKENYGFPEAFSVQNTKNVKERSFKVQKILSDAGLNKGVTLSMQSLHSKTLELIKRDNINLDTYRELQDRFMYAGVLTYSDLILGLPGETFESWVNGVNTLITNGQHNRIQFNNLSLLPNAEMSSEFERESAGFLTVNSQIVNVHGSRTELMEDVPEVQELVVATKTMPKIDWVKSRVYAWWVAFLYFDKLLQLPLALFNKNGVPTAAYLIKEIIDFVDKLEDQSILKSIHSKFVEKATAIQQGDVEYIWNESFLDVYWPADEYIFIKLVNDELIGNFYEELENVVSHILKNRIEDSVLVDFIQSIRLNSKIIRLPKHLDNDVIFTENEKDLLVKYLQVLNPHLEQQNIIIETIARADNLNFSEWQRKVVWYGHRSGSYLKNFYKLKTLNYSDGMAEIPGHF